MFIEKWKGSTTNVELTNLLLMILQTFTAKLNLI